MQKAIFKHALANGDEMSLLMMINKVQTPEDLKEFLCAAKDGMGDIVQTAPEHILEIIGAAIWSLCMKMNMPQEEAAEFAGKVVQRQMGYWFENMEKMDIQEERRRTEEERRKLRETEERLREEEWKNIKNIISLCREFGNTREVAVTKVMEKAGLPYEEAEEWVGRIWD